MCLAQLISGLAAGTLLGLTVTAGNPSFAGNGSSIAKQSPVEDIYVLHSVLKARSTTPSGFCDATKVGFSAQIEDRYIFKAVTTRAKDGLVVDANRESVGTLQGCFEGVPGAADTNFYGEGNFAGVTATGKGKCTVVAVDFPEPGITSSRCFLVLSNLSPPYYAGVLTANSIRGRDPFGERSNPPGYIQLSIATIQRKTGVTRDRSPRRSDARPTGAPRGDRPGLGIC